MIPASVLVLLLQAPSGGVWPTTVSGWIALTTGIISLLVTVIGGAVAYGRAREREKAMEERFTERLNGFGERVTKTEGSLARIDGAETERVRQLDRTVLQYEQLVAATGEAKQAAQGCRDEASQHALDLGSRVAAMDRDVRDFRLEISQRMTRVETKARINPKDFDNGE